MHGAGGWEGHVADAMVIITGPFQMTPGLHYHPIRGYYKDIIKTTYINIFTK
jgi:hypothetical protein